MINFKAIAYFPVVLAKPHLLVPDVVVPRLSEIDLEALVRSGVTGVLLDYDDTLVSSSTGKPMPGSAEFAQRCRQSFPGRVSVFSDSAGTPRDTYGRIERAVFHDFRLPTLRHQSDKPGGIHEVRRAFGGSAAGLAIIGDRLLTDIVFGNRFGLASVWLRLDEPVGPFAEMERQLLGRRMRARDVEPFAKEPF